MLMSHWHQSTRCVNPSLNRTHFQRHHRCLVAVLWNRSLIVYELQVHSSHCLHVAIGSHKEWTPAIGIKTISGSAVTKCNAVHMSFWSRLGNLSPFEQMAAILQTIISNASSLMKIFESRKKKTFYWSLLQTVQLTRSRIGSDNGFAPNRWQAILWTNDDPVQRGIYAARVGDELIIFLVRMGRCVVCRTVCVVVWVLLYGFYLSTMFYMACV